MTTEAIERLEPFSFTSNEPSGLTEVDGAPGDEGADWADVWKFVLPAGFNYIFDPSSVLSAYLAYESQLVEAATMDDGGAFTDETEDARDSGTGDVEFVAATPANDDAFYFGHHRRFQEVTIDFSQAGAGSDITWVWEYYDGSAWATLPGQSGNAQSIWEDGTGKQHLSFTVPQDWERTLVDVHYKYFIRARITDMDTDFSTVPQATQIWVNGSTPEIANSNLVRVRWSDPNEQEERRLMGAVSYASVREFQQESKLYHMPIAGRIVVPENYVIRIQARTRGGQVDASGSDFSARCQRTRQALF